MALLVLYQCLYPFVALLALARVAGAGRWGAFREGLADISERLGRPAWKKSGTRNGPPLVWFHAASVGEVNALSEFIRGTTGATVVVTCLTVAGREKARTLVGVTAAFLAPADFYPCVASFLGRLRPDVLICAESEVWPMTLVLARLRGLRIGLVNACLSERSARRWSLAKPLSRMALAGVERAAYQTQADRERFEAIGVPASAGKVCGNTKHDLKLPTPEAITAAKQRVTAVFKGAPCWIAGSTRPSEEELVIAAHRNAASKVQGLRLILAPRHPERTAEVAELLRKSGLSVVRWSELLPFTVEPDCLLIDVMGALGALYPAAGVAFVGGTMVAGTGGHNILEPASLGVPVLFGRHTGAVEGEAAILLRRGGGRSVTDAASLGEMVTLMMQSPHDAERIGSLAKEAAASFGGAGELARDWLACLLLEGS